jgi:hypothetical protein
MGLYNIKEGLKILNDDATDASILTGTADPSVTGVAASVGSLYLKADGVSYKKTGAGDTDWQPYSEIEGGGLLWSTISGTATTEVSRGYILDASGGAFTVTMPAAPEEGDVVGFAGLGDIETNNVTVDLNGLNMNGSGDDLVIDLNYCYFEMLYTGDAATGWVLSNTDESGNVDNIQAFIGNDDNADAAVTEFTEENYVAGGDDLETAIDKLDMALAAAETTTSGVDDALDALEARVTVNEGDISSNDVDIATNASGIAANLAAILANDIDIATNASGIAANLSAIQSNDVDIAANTAAIEANDIDIATNASGISALESFTGSAGASSPDYTTEHYISDGDNLEAAISKLDAALKVVDNLAATGVNWRSSIVAVTGEVVNTGAGAYSGTDKFADDDEPFWDYSKWSDGDEVLSVNATTSGIIYTWNAAGDQWVQTSALGANDAVSVRYDFLDSPGSQEDGAAYMMNADQTEVIKIADFDLENASTIGLSSAYTATSGTIATTDSVESAIAKLDGRADAAAGDFTALEARVTTNEGDIASNDIDIATNASGIAANAAAIASNDIDIAANTAAIEANDIDIATNASGIAVNAGDIDDLEAAMGSATGLDGMDYTSTSYVTTDTSAVDAISALDTALTATDATVSGLGEQANNNYQYIVNVDTAHDNLAAAVLTESTTAVSAASTNTVVDTVAQAGTLGAKWFVMTYDGSGNRYACEIYAMHDGSTTADLTEYAILTIGTKLGLDFDVVADGTNMTLVVDNDGAGAVDVTVKTHRTTVSTATVDTTAVLS